MAASIQTDYYTVAEVTAMLKISRSKIYEMIRDGELSIAKFGSLTRITANSYNALKERAEGNRAA